MKPEFQFIVVLSFDYWKVKDADEGHLSVGVSNNNQYNNYIIRKDITKIKGRQ